MTNAAAMFRRTVILLCTFFLGTTTVHAQGTMGQVADPMNSKQLAKYLKRYVKPTFEQWIVIEDIHEDYLEKFAALRDGPITDFLQEAHELNSSGGMPDIESIKKYFASQEKINGRIRRLDDQCFNSMVEIMREDQIAGLQRAQLARKRARLQSGMVAQMMGSPSSDLWTAIEKVDFDEDEMAVLLARLRPYEESATRLSQKSNDAAASILLRVAEELQARGFADIDFSDPENMNPELMQELMAAYQAGYKAAMEESGEASADFRALNYRTLRDLTHAVDPWKTLEVKRNSIGRNMIGMAYGISSTTPFAEAELTEDLPGFELVTEGLRGKDELLGDLRDQFNELMQAYVMEEHRRTDRVLKIIGEFDLVMAQLAQVEQAVGGTDTEADGELSLEEQVAEIEVARRKSEQEYTRQLFALIEAEGSPELNNAVKKPWGLAKYGDAPEVGQEQILDIYVEEESNSMGSAEVMRTGLEMERRGWAPDAMGVRVLGKIRRRVGEEVWVQALLEALHEEYLEQWESQVGPLQDQLQKAESETHIWDPETESGVFNEVAFKRLYELRTQLIELTASVDGRFFENLILAMPDEAAESMRVLRAERTFDRSLGGSVSGVSMFPGGDGAGYANPIEVLNKLDLSAEDRVQVDQVVLAIQEELIETQRALQKAQFEVERSMTEYSYANFRSDVDFAQEDGMDAMMEYQRLSRESLETIKPHQEEALKKRDLLFQRVSESLSEEDNDQFIEAYRIASHPSIYRDTNSVKPAIEGALRLANLSPEQEERLQELLAQYESDWLMRSHRMAEAQAEFGDGNMMTSEGLQTWMAANMKSERARFDRDELTARTLRRLARILHAEQRRYIHALRGIEDEIGEDTIGSHEAAVMVE